MDTSENQDKVLLLPQWAESVGHHVLNGYDEIYRRHAKTLGILGMASLVDHPVIRRAMRMEEMQQKTTRSFEHLCDSIIESANSMRKFDAILTTIPPPINKRRGNRRKFYTVNKFF